MARSMPDDRIGRLFRRPSGQDELFDKSHERRCGCSPEVQRNCDDLRRAQVGSVM